MCHIYKKLSHVQKVVTCSSSCFNVHAVVTSTRSRSTGGVQITEIQSLSSFKQMLAVSICFNKRYRSPLISYIDPGVLCCFLGFYSSYHFFSGGICPCTLWQVLLTSGHLDVVWMDPTVTVRLQTLKTIKTT